MKWTYTLSYSTPSFHSHNPVTDYKISDLKHQIIPANLNIPCLCTGANLDIIALTIGMVTVLPMLNMAAEKKFAKTSFTRIIFIIIFYYSNK